MPAKIELSIDGFSYLCKVFQTTNAMTTADRYSQRGVSAAKEDVHNAICNIEHGLFANSFCKIVPDILTGDPEFCCVMHADGAGTKSSLAYMYCRETKDYSVWKGIAQDAVVMNLDDLICVGALDNILLSCTIGRNRNLIPGDMIATLINGMEEVLSELRQLGIGIYSTGGETADVGDLVRTIIVDSTVVCRLPRKDVVLVDPGRAMCWLVWPPLGKLLTRRSTTPEWAATGSPQPGTMCLPAIWWRSILSRSTTLSQNDLYTAASTSSPK